VIELYYKIQKRLITLRNDSSGSYFTKCSYIRQPSRFHS